MDKYPHLKAVLQKPKHRVSLIERDNKHFYSIDDGSELPGVTGILSVINKPALLNWAKKIALGIVEREILSLMKGQAIANIQITTEWLETLIAEAKKKPTQIMEDAGNVGTKAHQWIDSYIKNKAAPKQTEDIVTACNNFLRFWKQEGLRFLAGDTKVASQQHGFGGSFDFLALDRNNDLVLGDLKTSNGIWPEYGAQLGGYSIALWETFLVKPVKGLIIRVGKENAEYEIGWVKDLPVAEKAFLAAKVLKETLSDKGFVIKESEEHGKKDGRNIASTTRTTKSRSKVQ